MAKNKSKQAVRITAKELVMREIDELVPYANNAKVHSPEQISAIRSSLREFGFVTPVLIDETGNIIAGHGRVQAARAEGMTQVPCVLADGLTETQRKAYILADNRMAEMAEWDKAMLKIELEGLDALDFGVEALGFNQDYLADLFLDAGSLREDAEKDGHFWDGEGETNEEYEEFTEKFKPKLTTDDCYTPSNIYECVKEWAVRRYGLDAREIVRPFFPGGDYEHHEYPEGCVVIDNPPFSILSAICKFYESMGIAYFLFAPGLSLFSTNAGRSRYVVTGAAVTYENGATVSTSFVTNLGEYRVETAPDLFAQIKEADDINRRERAVELPDYAYPVEVMRVADAKLAKYGQALRIRDEDALFVRALDAQRAQGKAIFGGGFLLSEKAAAEKAAVIKWPLSDRELALIRTMSNHANGKEQEDAEAESTYRCAGSDRQKAPEHG